MTPLSTQRQMTVTGSDARNWWGSWILSRVPPHNAWPVWWRWTHHFTASMSDSLRWVVGYFNIIFFTCPRYSSHWHRSVYRPTAYIGCLDPIGYLGYMFQYFTLGSSSLINFPYPTYGCHWHIGFAGYIYNLFIHIYYMYFYIYRFFTSFFMFY